MSSLLNYKLQGEGQTIVLLHGLFGNLDNLGLLARDLVQDHQVLSVDLRNHGLSFHSESHTYEEMAEDVKALLEHLNLSDVILVGHSMGGKVAMKLASLIEDKVKKLVVLDMSPVAYTESRHDNVFAGLHAVENAKPSSRSEAMKVMAEHIEMEGVRQFLGKSLYKESDHLGWRFNVESLFSNYRNIISWEEAKAVQTPALLIKGGNSDYLTEAHQPAVMRQFPNAKAHVIANTGHWLHAEKPNDVLRVMRRFIAA
ncbi:putative VALACYCLOVIR HYDROLASE [Vibrio nigripulchritudo SOn1]|uniref:VALACYCLOVIR HYDROLASE n=1 Tax=Vibrio nigripulchritudo SOn1 TaxID=1238450 RepID=A0AAV2VXK0_9VIBR|nr:alpha/beta fold hydrolase [Vibrio nigripulchritudo]CCO49331.1 putative VALACYCLOVIR HYDROLASE [Vibrio nigripulchritudo SOn1]